MTVHSIDRTSGTTKLERLSKRAETDKSTVFNNLRHMVDETLLREMYQKLDGKKAIGMDGMSKERYGKRLAENLASLIRRIRNGTYRPKPSRIIEIPKGDGGKRPLAIACFEYKLVQAAVSDILTRIYEPLFLPCSYGFRPGRNCHDALRALMKETKPFWSGAIVEIDICKYFTSIPHKELSAMLRKKISDESFLRLIGKLTSAPVQMGNATTMTTQGCPQGSILSPILANIYLHEVIDTWFDEIKNNHFKDGMAEIRYVDDMVFAFQNHNEAKRFYEVLPKRLRKYGLDIQEEKSRLIRSGQNIARREHRAGKRVPTYNFLGFTVYWRKARNGQWWRMTYTSRPDRMVEKLKGLRKYLKTQLSAKNTKEVLQKVIAVVRGWVNYHNISDNEKKVHKFIHICRRHIRTWMNRRGGRKPMSWEKFNRLMDRINFPENPKTISMF